MTARKEPDSKAIFIMLILCALWGSQQVLIKIIADLMTPIMQMTIRCTLGAMLVGAMILWQRKGRELLRVPRWPALGVGFLFGLEFFFTGEALRYTSAAHVSIFLYTAPIFTALGLHWRMPEERMNLMQAAGICVAFLGVAVTFLGKHHGAGQIYPLGWLGDLLGVFAGASWAMTILVLRFSALSTASASVSLFCHLSGAAVFLAMMTMLLGQTSVHYTPMLLADLGFQTLFISFGSFLAWLALLRVYLASRLGTLSFMTPVFGIAAGVIVLHDHLDPAFILGAGMIVMGIILVNGQALLSRRRLRATA